MSIDSAPTRRTVLIAGAAGAGAAALAACGTSSGSSSGGSAPKVTGTLTSLDKVPVGGAIAVNAQGNTVIVARPTSTTAVAFSSVCTHQGCTVVPNGAKLECPCHGSVFNALTGAVEQGPAGSPLPKVPVQVKDGQVVSAPSSTG